MKMTTMKKSMLGSTVLLLSLGLSASLFAAVNVDLEIQSVNGANVLVVTRNNSQCADGPIDCIEVKAGTKPHLFFSLQGACAGTDYKLTKFRIAERNKQWPTPGTPLSAQVASDFCADANSGDIDFMTCDNDLRDAMMKLKDFNSAPGTVYYEVTAEHCMNPNDKIYLDPRIENKG